MTQKLTNQIEVLRVNAQGQCLELIDGAEQTVQVGAIRVSVKVEPHSVQCSANFPQISGPVFWNLARTPHGLELWDEIGAVVPVEQLDELVLDFEFALEGKLAQPGNSLPFGARPNGGYRAMERDSGLQYFVH